MRRPLLFLGVCALLAGGCGSGSEEATTVTVTTEQTVTLTTPAAPATTGETGGTGGSDCSASALSADLPADGSLPAAVAETRQEIATAAVACDYDRLQAIALEQDGFTYSYGGETSAADFWAGEEERGEQPLKILVESLRQPGHEYQGNWVWPRAYTDAPTDADWAALSGLYSQDEITSWRETGQYLGYRVGITPKGDWQYFVSGD